MAILGGESLRIRRRPAGESAAPLIGLSRADVLWAAVTGMASAALFATTLSAHTYLGDAPETVTGVMSLGILHDPGYISYVIVARLFTLLEPFGSAALRVNLFSLVCAALTIAGLQLLARRCGARRWAASLAALAFAASAGFWFYAGFAKHDVFSGLMFLITLHLILSVRERPTTRRLITLAVVAAIGLGSSWPLMALLAPAAAYVLFGQRRRLSLRPVLAALATGLVLVVALGGFVMIRAAANPPVNWGQVTTVARLVKLVGRSDFVPHASSSGHTHVFGHAAHHGPHLRGGVPGGPLGSYGYIFMRELGVVALLLAALGVVTSLRGRRSAAAAPLVIVFIVNLLGASAVVGPSGSGNYDVDLIEEGFILGCLFVLTIWTALGATELVAAGPRLRARSPQWIGALRAPSWLAGRPVMRWLTIGVLALAILIPQIVAHRSVAQRGQNNYADRFASAVFSELPPHAAIFMWGADLTFPLIEQQVLHHVRPDVAVIAADGLSYAWYREQDSRRLGLPLGAPVGNSVSDATLAIQAVRLRRPVYLDLEAALVLQDQIGYRPVGLIAALAGGHGPAPVAEPQVLADRVNAVLRTSGFPAADWRAWPSIAVAQLEYAPAAFEVARAFYEHRDYTGMRHALENVLAVQPGQPDAVADLAKLNALG